MSFDRWCAIVTALDADLGGPWSEFFYRIKKRMAGIGSRGHGPDRNNSKCPGGAGPLLEPSRPRSKSVGPLHETTFHEGVRFPRLQPLLRGNGCADPLYALAASSCGATPMAICSERHLMVPLFTDVDFYRRRFRGAQRIARNGRMLSWPALAEPDCD